VGSIPTARIIQIVQNEGRVKMSEEPQDWIHPEPPSGLNDQKLEEWMYQHQHTGICPNCGNDDVMIGLGIDESCDVCDWMPPQWRKIIDQQNAGVDAYLHMEKRHAIEQQFRNDPGQAQIELEQLEYERRWDKSEE
jgi:hypothetical protein